MRVKLRLFYFLIFIFCLFFSKEVYSNSTSIKIGLTLGLTGIYSDIADQQMKGLRLWERDVNNRGGILGKKVEIIIYDDKGSPDVSKRLYELLINRDKVDFILGPYSSSITEAVAPVAERYKYPMLVSGASADSIWEKGYKYVFGIFCPASKYSLGFLRLLLLNNINDIAIVYADDPFSENVAEGAKKWAKRLGFNVSHFERFKKNTEDLVPVAQKAMASKAMALIVCGHLAESINMKLSLERIGWNPVYFASVGPATDLYYQRLGEKAELTFSSSQWEPSRFYPKSMEFYESFRNFYKMNPSYHAATAYAACQLLEMAIRKANSLNKEKIRNVLSFMDTITVIGRYKVDARGMQIGHENFVIQWQKGKRQIVGPDTLKTANSIF